MEIKVTRTYYTRQSTIGQLDIDGIPYCDTLEDVVRAPGVKIKKETAIPAGRYVLKITWSYSHNRNMLQVMDVPMFSGIRLHGGNSKDDTEGCILLGMHRGIDHISECKEPVDHIYQLVQDAESRGEPSWITIVNTKDPVV